MSFIEYAKLIQCPKCGMHKYSNAICACEIDYALNQRKDSVQDKDACYPISVGDLMKADKRVAELEDKVKLLEESLEESEAEIMYKEAQLELALNLAKTAHDMHAKMDNLMMYKDQPELPLGDLPT